MVCLSSLIFLVNVKEIGLRVCVSCGLGRIMFLLLDYVDGHETFGLGAVFFCLFVGSFS